MKLQIIILMAGLLAAGGAQAADGAKVFNATCMSCHGAGIMGAPKLGDKAAWAPRISKGRVTLYQHALRGFNNMPAKGGNEALPDADVKAAVDYMVQHAD